MELRLTKVDGKVKMTDQNGNVLGWLSMDADEKRQQTFSATILRFMKGESVASEQENTSSRAKKNTTGKGFRYENGNISVDEETLKDTIRGVSSFLSGMSRK